MIRVEKIGLASSLLLGTALFLAYLPASAQSLELGNSNQDFSLDRTLDYIARAHDPKNKEITANSRAPTGRHYSKNILISKSGTPLLSYFSKNIGSKLGRSTIELSFSCERVGTLDIMARLFNPDRIYNPETNFSLNLNDRYELYIMPYGLNNDYLLPVKIIKATQPNNIFIQVHGAVNANNSFFKNLRSTTNFQVQLKQNGQYTSYNGGVAMTDFEVSIKPLLQHCRGELPSSYIADNTKSSTRTKIASLWTPDAIEIKDALQRRLDTRLQAINRAAEACNRVRGNPNPIIALNCLFGSAMKSFGKIEIAIKNIQLDKCVRSKDNIAYCRYDVSADTSLPRSAANFEKLIDGAIILERWVWGSYVRSNGRWEHQKTFINCDVDDSKVQCTY